MNQKPQGAKQQAGKPPIAKSPLDIPFEILKGAGDQIMGADSAYPEMPGTGLPPAGFSNEPQYPNMDIAKANDTSRRKRLMEALEAELAQIRRERAQKAQQIAYAEEQQKRQAIEAANQSSAVPETGVKKGRKMLSNAKKKIQSNIDLLLNKGGKGSEAKPGNAST